MPGLVHELQEELPHMPASVAALSLSLARLCWLDTQAWHCKRCVDYAPVSEG